MQWDTSAHAGFTDGPKPWMRVNDNYTEINASSQVADPNSVYNTWRQVLEKRKLLKDVFVYGDFTLLDESNEKVFAYVRRAANGQSGLVVANFSGDNVAWEWAGNAVEIILSPAGKTTADVNSGKIDLKPYEAVALLLHQ